MTGIAFVLLTAAGLAAQPISGDAANASAIRRLNSTLLTLKDGNSRSAVGRQIAADIASAADQDHRPSAALVKALADDLTAALPATSLRVEMLTRITTPLVEVLHPGSRQGPGGRPDSGPSGHLPACGDADAHHHAASRGIAQRGDFDRRLL